jgi:SAM-dependent methyltransferase
VQSLTPLDFYRFHGRLQPFRYLYGLDACRYLEYSWTANALQPLQGAATLDVGASRSPFTILLAEQGAGVVALDQDPLVMDLPTMATRANMVMAARNIDPQLQDARTMPFADGHFGRVCAVSVLEHIPEDGDSEVAREMSRVLAPGGLMALTLPYGQHYRSPGPEPEQEQYQRIYNDVALKTRVIEPSGLNVVKREHFGVRMPIPFMLLHAPTTKRLSRLFTGWVNAVMPSRVYGFLDDTELEKAGGVCLLLRKPEA